MTVGVLLHTVVYSVLPLASEGSLKLYARMIQRVGEVVSVAGVDVIAAKEASATAVGETRDSTGIGVVSRVKGCEAHARYNHLAHCF